MMKRLSLAGLRAPDRGAEPAAPHSLPGGETRNARPYGTTPTPAERIAARSARVAVLGLGYVGVPLAAAVVGAGFPVLGFDPQRDKVEAMNAGRSFIRHIAPEVVTDMRATGRFAATADPVSLLGTDIFVVCVPTPLDAQRDPDLSYVESAARIIARHLRPGCLVILESTTYPGTTDEVMRPLLEQGGLKSGADFFLAFSPEREDPGNDRFGVKAIPKVVGGDGAEALALASAFYESFVDRVVPVSSTRVAEAVKLTENVFRSVNIALVNELKGIYAAMGVDIWEVVDAARTKPFGFMAFYPGPGLGGHCIPIDPFYLSWKAKAYGLSARFIELSGEINRAMPDKVVERTAVALDARLGLAVSRSRILVFGVAYKKNVDDTRESPALAIMQTLLRRGAAVSYYDPYVPDLGEQHEAPAVSGMRSIAAADCAGSTWDAALILADHDLLDYAALTATASIVVDTRNAMAGLDIAPERWVKA